MSSIYRYPDSFVRYCFHMGKLEADKIFWTSLMESVVARPVRRVRTQSQERSYVLPLDDDWD